jgi:threonine dehydrogenase-like Zn-dependent dehydrogenase
MGLLLQLLNRAGARSVSVVDRKAARLQAAKALGAVGVAEDVAALDRGAFGVAVDATGAPPARSKTWPPGSPWTSPGLTDSRASQESSPAVLKDPSAARLPYELAPSARDPQRLYLEPIP